MTMITAPSQWTCVFLITAYLIALTNAFQPISIIPSQHTRYQRFGKSSCCTPSLLLLAASSDDVDANDEVQRLRQSAQALRAEAVKAQEELASKRSVTASASRTVDRTSLLEVVEYDSVADSCWEIT